MEVGSRGAWTASNAGTGWFGRHPAPVGLLRVQIQIGGWVDELRSGVGGVQVEPEVLPVIVDIIKDHDLAVAHNGHAPRGCRVIRLIIYAVLCQAIIQIANTFRHIVLYVIAIQDRIVVDDPIGPVSLRRIVVQNRLGWVSTHRVHLRREHRLGHFAVDTLSPVFTATKSNEQSSLTCNYF